MTVDIKNYGKLKNYITAPTSEKVAVCKVTGIGTFDYKNQGGALTRILKKQGIEFKDPFNHFHILDNPFFNVKKEVGCKLCDFTCKTNRDGSLTRHLTEHKISPETYINSYPDQQEHFAAYKKQADRVKLFENKKTYIVCPLCNQKFKKITGSHLLRVHNTTPEEFLFKTGITNRSSEATLEKKRANYFEVNQHVDSKMNKPSRGEQEIREYVQSLLPHADLTKKKYLPGVEIDIYVEELRVGIEFNGLYYHAEKSMGRGRKYHLNKTQVAEKYNIHLLQIFSDEWKHQRSVVKSKIKHILKCNSGERIYARECKLLEITPSEKKNFLEKNHIQGNSNSSYNYGAYHGDKLVAVATFAKPRISTGAWKDSTDRLELVRFCTAEDTNVVGILPRFLKRIIRDQPHIKVIHSYADRRYTTKKSNIYEKVGFKLVGETVPSYWYTKYQEKRYHRFTFTKQRLKKLGVCEEGKTEWEMMQNLKYDRIWDCGNLKYEWGPYL